VLPHTNIHIADLANRELIMDTLNRIKPDVVIHTAAFGGFSSQTNKELIVSANLNGTINLVDAAISAGVKRFINTGSSSEYGVKNEPMQEDMHCQPVNLYGITKLAATNYCSMMAKSTDMKICTLRLFSPYGKYEKESRLYASIFNALQENKQPKLANKNSVRDFIPIEDVTHIYKLFILNQFPTGEVYNVGSGEQRTIAKFYADIATQLGKSNIEPVWGVADSRAVEPQCWVADITKLQSWINGCTLS
jgi:nucleoside-diphosphate-sugar epimerase